MDIKHNLQLNARINATRKYFTSEGKRIGYEYNAKKNKYAIEYGDINNKQVEFFKSHLKMTKFIQMKGLFDKEPVFQHIDKTNLYSFNTAIRDRRSRINLGVGVVPFPNVEIFKLK